MGVRDYKKGDEISAVVLQVDPERERISLGVKQIEEDPFNKYLTDNKKGAIVTGTVTAVDAKGVTVNLAEEVDGYIRVADLAVERVEDATEVASVGIASKRSSWALTVRTALLTYLLKRKI